jgi:hypothetical protein
MLITEASVETDRPNRYLVQLCTHISEVAKAHPQMPARVEWSDDDGVITLGSASCTLQARPGALTLHIEAPDEDSLRQIQARVTDRLEQIGRRDGLSVRWNQ